MRPGIPAVIVACRGCQAPDVADRGQVVVTADPEVAAAYGLLTVDGQLGPGYAIVDARGRIRYRTFYPGVSRHAKEIGILLGPRDEEFAGTVPARRSWLVPAVVLAAETLLYWRYAVYGALFHYWLHTLFGATIALAVLATVRLVRPRSHANVWGWSFAGHAWSSWRRSPGRRLRSAGAGWRSARSC